jgi:hypothetical protein
MKILKLEVASCVSVASISVTLGTCAQDMIVVGSHLKLSLEIRVRFEQSAANVNIQCH